MDLENQICVKDDLIKQGQNALSATIVVRDD